MAQIFKGKEVKEWDQYTIQNEPISSIDLMERAANKLKDWITLQYSIDQVFAIFCGSGNNGGDGLALARMLDRINYKVTIFDCQIHPRSNDNLLNFKRLPKRQYLEVKELSSGDELPELSGAMVIIDALFGSGISRPLEGYWLKLVEHLNQSGASIISIDLPSGLHPDLAFESECIQADITLSFQTPKLAFFLPESHQFVGKWTILDIGLLPEWKNQQKSIYHYIQKSDVLHLLHTRSKFDHKGTFGHALMVCGSYGKIGAAILAARACLRSGVGLLTLQIPKIGYQVVQTAIPEAMVIIDQHDFSISNIQYDKKYDAVGIGCGIGTKAITSSAFRDFLAHNQSPVVLDADAINLLSLDHDLLEKLPVQSILTPHPGEFRRLIGPWQNDIEKINKLAQLAKKYEIIIVLKGAHTCIGHPNGNLYFNTTGNPGMGTAGSGDVLTGMLTSLLAQRYTPLDACIIAVFLHGLAGDIAAREGGQEALIASDIIDHIGKAYQETEKPGE